MDTEDTLPSLSGKIAKSLKSIQYQHMQQRQAFAKHHTKNAYLLAADTGLELRTCDDTLIRISSQLLAEANLIKTDHLDFTPGEMVTIEFDAGGKIIAIRNATAAIC